MKALELLVSSLDPARVYRAGEQVAWVVFGTITPVLLVIAVAVRTLETQLDTNTGLGKWERALRDFFLFGFLIGSYFGIMILFNVLMNEIYQVTHEIGNFDLLAAQIKRLLAKANQGGGGSISQGLGNFAFGLTDPFRWIMSIFYWASNLFVISAHVFLKGAHGIIYSFVFVYGLIAIPLSMTSNFKLLKGWATLLGGTLLWPIVEGLLLGFFGVLFQDAAQDVIRAGSALAYENDGDFKAFFSVVNVVLALIMIMAPVISAYLVANANAMFALVAPFASGAMSVGFGAMAASKAILPGGRGLSGMRAAAGMMGLTASTAFSGSGSGGSSAGGASGGPSYSGGPGTRAEGASSGASGSGSPSSGGSGSGEGSPLEAQSASGSQTESASSPEALEAVKAKKKRRSQKGYFVNQWRQKQR